MSVNTAELKLQEKSALRQKLHTTYRAFKRGVDICMAATGIIPAAAIMGVTALAIKIEDPKAPVFFWQRRVGMNGVPFDMLKFRSMTTNSEDNGSQFAQAGDMRVTRIGKFIRKYRVDEIPQIWNVLKGDMSVIGPRPEQEKFVEEFNKTIPNYRIRHMVRPGITGLAQTEQGYVADAEGTAQKLKYDIYYVENFGFRMDIQICLNTLYTICTGFGAR